MEKDVMLLPVGENKKAAKERENTAKDVMLLPK